MHILVDEMPNTPRDCLFSLVSYSGEYANCKLKMQDDGDWEYRTFNGGCTCDLMRNRDCPYLKCLLDHFGGKKTSPEIDYKVVEETKQRLYNSLGLPKETISNRIRMEEILDKCLK